MKPRTPKVITQCLKLMSPERRGLVEKMRRELPGRPGKAEAAGLLLDQHAHDDHIPNPDCFECLFEIIEVVAADDKLESVMKLIKKVNLGGRPGKHWRRSVGIRPPSLVEG